MNQHIIRASDHLIINARHVVSAEWDGKMLHIYTVVGTPFPSLTLTGDEARFVWAKLCALAAAPEERYEPEGRHGKAVHKP